METAERARLGPLDRPSYLSFAQYDARQFGGELTRGIVEAYVDEVRSVYSAGAAAAELERELAAARDWTVRAIDLDEAVVRAARSRSLPANLTVEVGNVRDPPEREHDVALAFGTIQELVGCPVEGLRGLGEALRPGGLALIAVPNLANMLQVVRPGYLRLDDSLDGDRRLAVAELGPEDGGTLTQYGFTREGQSFRQSTADLAFDPATLTPFEELARRAGFLPAATEPLAAWADRVRHRSTGGECVDGLALEVRDGFPVSMPVDPGGLVGASGGPPLQERVESFDPAAAGALASSIEQRGLDRYRLAQAREPELAPRVDFYALERPVREPSG